MALSRRWGFFVVHRPGIGNRYRYVDDLNEIIAVTLVREWGATG
jgi:hypothetical protein